MAALRFRARAPTPRTFSVSSIRLICSESTPSQLVAPLEPSAVPECRISIQPVVARALRRISRIAKMFRATPESREQSRSGELGSAESHVLERHCRALRRLAIFQSQSDQRRCRSQCCGTTAVTTLRLEAISAGRNSTIFRNRIRAAHSLLPARRLASDFADFLLGIPDTSSIAFGNADKYFRDSALRCLYHRRLASQSGTHGECGSALGVWRRRSRNCMAGW